MAAQEEDLQIRMGSGEWRSLRVRQFEVTETLPDNSEVPTFLHMGQEDAEHIGFENQDMDVETTDPSDEVATAFAEGGKHAFVPTGVEDGEHHAEDHLGEAEQVPDSEDVPDWVQSFEGVRFFTLNQALSIPAALHLRTLDFYRGLHTSM